MSKPTDFKTLQELDGMNNRIAAGGFALVDTFDTFLQNVSVQYLQKVASKVSGIITQYSMDLDDLSWGLFHPGETYVSGFSERSPLYFAGLSSCHLTDFDRDNKFSIIDRYLSEDEPIVRCVATWRSLKWRINPDDYELALELLEYICTSDPGDWNPEYVLYKSQRKEEPWVKVATAIYRQNRSQLDEALQEARVSYSSLGYKILIQGYHTYIHTPWETD